MVVHTLTRRQRQADRCDFKTPLVYTVRLSPSLFQGGGGRRRRLIISIVQPSLRVLVLTCVLFSVLKTELRALYFH